MRSEIVARFWTRVDVRGPDECWPWLGSLNRDGYGQFWDGERTRPAHCVMYELKIGPIPAGHEVDHDCHTTQCPITGRGCPHRRCMNFAHYQARTRRENALRSKSFTAQNAAKTCCPKCGGPYTLTTTGVRRCRACQNRRRRHLRSHTHRIPT